MSLEIDVVGLKCPMPLMRLQKVLQLVAPSDVVLLKATDDMTLVDIPDFCEQKKHLLLHKETRDGVYYFTIQKRALPEKIHIQTLMGKDIKSHIAGLAKLRIDVFKEWPYLYEGHLEHEQDYLKTFSEQPDAALVCAFDRDTLIGAATCSPMIAQDDWVKNAFLESAYDISKIYYFGESVLLSPYRGLGLGHVFFNEREKVAKLNPDIQSSCFCAVVRDGHDPRKPQNYKPLHGFWQKRGYGELKGIVAHLKWPEMGNQTDIEHVLQFWMNAFIKPTVDVR